MTKNVDIFKENDKHSYKLEIFPIIFKDDKEIDASKINFSDLEVLDFTFKILKEAGVI